MADEVRGFLHIPRPGEFAVEGIDFAWEVSRDKSESGEPLVVLKLTKAQDELDFVRLAFQPERSAALAVALTEAQNEASGQGSGTAE